MSQEQVIHSIVVSWATKWVSTETPVPSERPGWLMGVPTGFGSNISMVHSPHWTGACNWQIHWPMVVLSTAQKTQKQMAAAKKGDSSLLKESHGLHVSWNFGTDYTFRRGSLGILSHQQKNIRSSLVVQLRAKYTSVVLLSLEIIVPHWKTKTVWHQRILVVVSPFFRVSLVKSDFMV